MPIAVFAGFVALGLYNMGTRAGPSLAITPNTLVLDKATLTRAAHFFGSMVLLAAALLLLPIVLLTLVEDGRLDRDSLLWALACLCGCVAFFFFSLARPAVTFSRAEGTVRRGKNTICSLKAVRAVLIDQFTGGYTGLLTNRTGAALLLIYWDASGTERRYTLAESGDLNQLKQQINDFLRADNPVGT